MVEQKSYKQLIYDFITDFKFTIPVSIVALLSYGFLITHQSLSIDDLANDRYFAGGDLIAQGRFTAPLLNIFFGGFDFFPFITALLSVILLIFAAILICALFKRTAESLLNPHSYTVFTCIFISYPLINEIFSYDVARLIIGLGLTMVAVTLILQTKYIETGEIKYVITAVIMTVFIVSLYESLIPVYLCGVFCVLIIRNISIIKDGQGVFNISKKLFKYLIPVVLGIIIEGVLSNVLIWIMGLRYSLNAATKIEWFTGGNFFDKIVWLFQSIIYAFGSTFLVYLPITVFLISVVLFIFFMIILLQSFKNRRIGWLFSGLFLSVFSLSFVQGFSSTWRSSQVLSLFVAFVFLLFTQWLLVRPWAKPIKVLGILLIVFLIMNQANDLNKWFYVDDMRYQEELQIVKNIGNKLQESFDPTKPVVFIGEIKLSENIKKYSYVREGDKQFEFSKWMNAGVGDVKEYKYLTSNVNSYINWSIYAFFQPGSELIKWFKLLGYNVQGGSMEQYNQALKYLRIYPAYPKKGYIFEAEGMTIVNFGP